MQKIYISYKVTYVISILKEFVVQQKYGCISKHEKNQSFEDFLLSNLSFYI